MGKLNGTRRARRALTVLYVPHLLDGGFGRQWRWRQGQNRLLANVANTRQLRPDSGLGFQVSKSLENVSSCSLLARQRTCPPPPRCPRAC